MGEKHGHLVRLWGIHESQFPSKDAHGDDLKPFLTSILGEALPFINDLPPASAPTAASPLKQKTVKKLPNSAAPVTLYERTVSAEDLQLVAKEKNLPHLNGAKVQPETWFLRRSVHEDAATKGTADWDEWVRSFKEGHADTEKEFTPTVMSTKLEQQWDCSGVEIQIGQDTWENLTLKLEQSVHKLPAPLKNRVFPVVQVTASARGRRDFVVAQIAARDLQAEKREDDGLVRAAYTSVERLRELKEGKPGIEWVMGTASDARGVLPAWMQKMAVPGAVAKDVDMFLDWISKERKTPKKQDESKVEEPAGTGAATTTTAAETPAETTL
jgi:hypothetical protein